MIQQSENEENLNVLLLDSAIWVSCTKPAQNQFSNFPNRFNFGKWNEETEKKNPKPVTVRQMEYHLKIYIL